MKLNHTERAILLLLIDKVIDNQEYTTFVTEKKVLELKRKLLNSIHYKNKEQLLSRNKE